MSIKIPKTIGECADLLFKVKAARLAKQKEVDQLEEDEKELKEYIIKTLPKSNASGVAGKVARVSVQNKDVQQVEDWVAFYKYVKKNDAFELLQRRLSSAAVQERLDDGQDLPGVKLIKVPQVSINKL